MNVTLARECVYYLSQGNRKLNEQPAMMRLVWLALFLTCFFKENAEADEDVNVGHPYEPMTDGANGLFIGHSFFIPIAREFNDYANQGSNFFSQHGFETEFSGGLSGSPGSLWLDVDHRTAINASLSTGTIDLFGMTSFDGDEDTDIQTELDAYLETGVYPSAEEYIPDYTQWIDLAISYNPDTTIFLGWHWMTYNHLLTAQNFTAYDEFLCGFFYSSIVLELRRTYPDTQILYVCYGPVASTMRQMFEDGNLPDIENQIGPAQTSLFTDDQRGHAGNMMKEMMGMVWLQMLYEPSPNLLEQYINCLTWDKSSARDIINEGLAFNEAYNLKEDAVAEPPTDDAGDEEADYDFDDFCNVGGGRPVLASLRQCLSEYSQVQILGKGYTFLKDVEQGDKVLVSTSATDFLDEYQKVYLFGHNDVYAVSEVLQITTLGNQGMQALEITGGHLVFKQKSHAASGGIPVRADSIEVGDFLIGSKGVGELVTQISSVKRPGLYSPITKHGKFLANGILVSSYTAMQEKHPESFKVGSMEVASHHFLSHVAIAPFRLLCLVPGGFTSLCEQRNHEGRLLFVALAERLSIGTQKQIFEKHKIVTILLLIFLVLFHFMEHLFGGFIMMCLLPVVWLLVATFLYVSFRNKKKVI